MKNIYVAIILVFLFAPSCMGMPSEDSSSHFKPTNLELNISTNETSVAYKQPIIISFKINNLNKNEIARTIQISTKLADFF